MNAREMFSKRRRDVWPRTWVGWLNFLVLQWLFIRLARVTHSAGTDWAVLRWVVPLTGWFSDYIWWPWRRR